MASNSGFEITIKYATELAGPDEGELLIRSNSIAAVTTVPIRANSEEPCIQVTPDRIDFGAGLLGGFNPRPLTIQSCGMEPLRIDALRLEATADVFGIDPESLPQLPLRVPAADPALPASEFPTRNLVVHFTPEEEIAYGGSLFVDSNDPYTPTLEVPLNGRGSQNECPNARVTTEEFFVAPLDVVTLDGAHQLIPMDRTSGPSSMSGPSYSGQWVHARTL